MERSTQGMAQCFSFAAERKAFIRPWWIDFQNALAYFKLVPKYNTHKKKGVELVFFFRAYAVTQPLLVLGSKRKMSKSYTNAVALKFYTCPFGTPDIFLWATLRIVGQHRSRQLSARHAAAESKCTWSTRECIRTKRYGIAHCFPYPWLSHYLCSV